MKPKTRKIPTPQSLANTALQYLGRYAASEASLRRVLKNRIRRAAMQHPDFADDGERKIALDAVINQLVEKYKKLGVLNDAAFAETKVNSLRREGRSRRAIIQKLGMKGVRGSLVDKALEKNADDLSSEEAEMKAALTFIRRRKMGLYRKKPGDTDTHRKELASLARGGFSLDIARRALKTEPPSSDP
jgi:regulatory protein